MQCDTYNTDRIGRILIKTIYMWGHSEIYVIIIYTCSITFQAAWIDHAVIQQRPTTQDVDSRQFIRRVLTLKKVECLRLLRGVSQVAVCKSIGLFPRAAVEWGQSQVLHKQLLRHKNKKVTESDKRSSHVYSELITVSGGRRWSGNWELNAAYCRLGGEKKSVLVDAGHVGGALHYQPHPGNR